MSRQRPVIVVGAGPAGAMAAFVLARRGIGVRLLDRAAFPRDKLCGDTLNPGSLALLDRRGIGAAVRHVSMPMTGMSVTGPGGAAVSAEYPGGLHGAVIRRSHLDRLLVDAAVAAGAQFETGVQVLAAVHGDDGRVRGVRVRGRHGEPVLDARLVIAADGRGSRVAGRLGLTRFAAAPKRWAFGAYYDGVADLTTRGEMHIRRDGYLGIAPLGAALANVCVVRSDNAVARAVREPARVIEEAIAAEPALRGRFEGAARISAVMVLGPLAVDARTAGAPGLLLAGDAAGFVDPMTGDGLRFALRGGELAADAAVDEITSGRAAHAALAAARTREFAGKWRVNRGLRTLVGSPAALAVASTIARRWAAPVEYLIGVAGDVGLAR